MIENKIISEFLGEINGVKFENAELYERCLGTLRIIGTSKEIDAKVVKAVKDFYINLQNAKDITLKEIDDIAYYEKHETYDRITYILKDVLNFITINIFVVILGTLSIVIYEASYRKSKEEYFIKGLEVNVLTYIYIVFSNTLIQARLNIKSMIIYALIIFVYYVIKSIVIYGIEKKKYIQNFIDTKDIVKDSRKKYIV